ncbi:hypothetical protein BCR44DRAFT_1169254 [Catenaria anguillulae PL171]|uniref:Uncharacterized protein n=1 Tax=Catenaria anguillulae PL171 TaxID=765915 RepID=A0A1Y2I413_9FUNG|nr:hypothetical protein BCR44DRAFT_1169254 [Catenaria anguillulae PL171]
MGTLHAFLMHAAAPIHSIVGSRARCCAVKAAAEARNEAVGQGRHVNQDSNRQMVHFGGQGRVRAAARVWCATGRDPPVSARGKQPRVRSPIPTEFYEDVRRVEVGGDVPPVPPLPLSPVVADMPKEDVRYDDDQLPYASRACLDSVDPDTRAAFDDLMVDLTRHPSVKLSDPTTPLMRTVSSFADLAKKLSDRTREHSHDEQLGQRQPAAAVRRAPPPPPIPTDEVNIHFANLSDRAMVSPRSTHSSIRRRKPRPSSGISESTDWSGTGSSAAAPLTNTSRTSSRAPTMDSGLTHKLVDPTRARCPRLDPRQPSIFPPALGPTLGRARSRPTCAQIHPMSRRVCVSHGLRNVGASLEGPGGDTTFDQALQIGFRVPAGALGVKQVVTTGSAVQKKVDNDLGSRRSSISMLRRFSNVSLASVSHALRHPVDAVRGVDSPRGSLTPASSNASLRSSVFGGSGSGYHPSARPSVDGASSIASTVKSRKSLLERLRFGSVGSRRSSSWCRAWVTGLCRGTCRFKRRTSLSGARQRRRQGPWWTRQPAASLRASGRSAARPQRSGCQRCLAVLDLAVLAAAAMSASASAALVEWKWKKMTRKMRRTMSHWRKSCTVHRRPCRFRHLRPGRWPEHPCRCRANRACRRRPCR